MTVFLQEPAKNAKTFVKNDIRNFELLITSAFKKKKGHRVEIRMVQAKKHKNKTKPKDVLKNATMTSYHTTLERYTSTTHAVKE